MNATTRFNHSERFKERTKGLYSDAYHFGWSHQKLLAERKRLVYLDPAWKRVPSYIQAIVFETGSMLLDRLYCYSFGQMPPLEAVNVGPDGRLFRKGQNDWLKETNLYKNSMLNFHVWRHLLAQGSFRPF